MLTVVPTTFSVPGIPAGSIIVMVPILIGAGLPAEGIGVLLGIDAITDMFRTAATSRATWLALWCSVVARARLPPFACAPAGEPAP